jgi:predicted AlkP superfamily pyrophosphatase or phosphodiesterase
MTTIYRNPSSGFPLVENINIIGQILIANAANGGQDGDGHVDMNKFTVNGRGYRLPTGPVAVECVDGCEEEYLDVVLTQGGMPSWARIPKGGWRGTARGALPSCTKVNNATIVTGAPPAITGLSGNSRTGKRDGSSG